MNLHCSVHDQIEKAGMLRHFPIAYLKHNHFKNEILIPIPCCRSTNWKLRRLIYKSIIDEMEYAWLLVFYIYLDALERFHLIALMSNNGLYISMRCQRSFQYLTELIKCFSIS